MSCDLQLEAMSRTDILITPCGGVGTVLTFLPPGATAIVMNYWHTTLQTSVQMERNYYWNLEYLDIQFFPVLPEDYELTTDRPSCEKGADDPYFEGQAGLMSQCAEPMHGACHALQPVCHLFVHLLHHMHSCNWIVPCHPPPLLSFSLSFSQSGCLLDITSKVPACMQGAYIACNVHIKNLQRVEDVVGSALQRWMVERNRYDDFDSLRQSLH